MPYKIPSENLKNVLIDRIGLNIFDFTNESFIDNVNLVFESDTLKMILIDDGEWLTVF